MLFHGQQHVGEAAEHVRPDRLALVGAGDAAHRTLVGRDAEVIGPEHHEPLEEGGIGGRRVTEASGGFLDERVTADLRGLRLRGRRWPAGRPAGGLHCRRGGGRSAVLPAAAAPPSPAPSFIAAPGSTAATRSNRRLRWASIRWASIADAKVTWLGSSAGSSMRARPGSVNDCRTYPRGSPARRPSSPGRAPNPKRLSAVTASRADIVAASDVNSHINGIAPQFRCGVKSRRGCTRPTDIAQLRYSRGFAPAQQARDAKRPELSARLAIATTAQKAKAGARRRCVLRFCFLRSGALPSAEFSARGIRTRRRYRLQTDQALLPPAPNAAPTATKMAAPTIAAAETLSRAFQNGSLGFLTVPSLTL